MHARINQEILAATMLLIDCNMIAWVEDLRVEANIYTLAEIVHGDEAWLRRLDRHRPRIRRLSSLQALIASLEATIVALAPRRSKHF
jgi:hypothetical protein